MKTLQRTIEFTGKDFVMPDPFPNKPVLVNDSLIDEAIPNFTVEIANSKHVFWVKEICDVTLSSAIARGTGISGRSPELLESKIRKGEAIIAFTSEGKWAGFSFISSWENGQYVSNSGLIVAPEFRHTGLAKTIKRKIFELSRQKYPDAKIFSLTTGLAVMKMNHEVGFEPVTYAQLTSDEVFWENCKSCVNCPILMSKERKNCLCTAMLYDPKHNRALNIK